MSALKRRSAERRSELFVAQRPPRLVFRFAVILSAALAVASAVILVVVHHFAISEAERAATRHASLVASAILSGEIRSSDLARQVTSVRRRELDRHFRTHLPPREDIEVSLVRKDGFVTYSTIRRAIGASASGILASDAARGTTLSRVSTNELLRRSAGGKTLETYTPIGHRAGAAAIVQPYSPIAQAARRAQFRVGVVLEGLLLVLFLVFVPLLARVTSRIKQQMERIHRQAYYDELTKLPNRAHMFERLDTAVHRARVKERQLAVLLLDLDQFREINSTLGHDAGDQLLAELAGRLQNAVGPEHLLARLGGDEFAIVIEYQDEREATTFAEEIRVALEPPVAVDGVPLVVESTIGIAFYPKDGADAETLLKHAEIATYAAKEWRVGVLAYSPAVDPHDADQLELVGSLREAAEQGELTLHYQPKIDLSTGAIFGFEALAYWEHPTRGLLAPGEFIPIAERTGAIRHVTRAVLAGAVKQLSQWSSLDQELTVAVNLTAIDLLDPKLPRQLKALLRKHRVEPSRLCIELTERTIMAAPDRARAIITRIVAAGVRVSIDDFGTGHSSLSHLKNLPVHEVKIDRSFVTDMTVSPHDGMIVRAAIQLGHSLGLRIVAEGVETSDVNDALRELGCDYAQGYLYGKPAPAETVTAVLAGEGRAAA